MVADPDGNIIYCNAAVMEMMRSAESDLRKDLPNFRADAIRGRILISTTSNRAISVMCWLP